MASASEQVWSGICGKISSLSSEESECSIFRLHSELRNVSSKAYDPQLLAIGPYHCNKDTTKLMEKHKLIYLQQLVRRKSGCVEKCIMLVSQMEQQARSFYADPIALAAVEFIEMLVLDGCFIVELVRKYDMEEDPHGENDQIFRKIWLLDGLVRDMLLFENQIPFPIVCILFDTIENPNNHDRLIYLIRRFLNRAYFGGEGACKTRGNINSSEIKHILELMHISWCPELSRLDRPNAANWQFVNPAKMLVEANVKFFRAESFDSLFYIKFVNGTLQMPLLKIEDMTESVFRNLIAYEEYSPDLEARYVTDYMNFVDSLINSSEDVRILRSYGIIENWLGDDEVVANMINKLGDSVNGPNDNFIYQEIFNSMNTHCDRRRNRWMANLRRNYLNTPWAIISVVGAIVLLLLTACQTVFTALQVVMTCT